MIKKFFLYFACAPLFATVIVQKNGDVISGKILDETPEKYVFQSPYGKLQISKGNIAKLILDEKTIELKNIEVGNKTVKARLVNQENNTAVYLTEDGQTIRKKDAEPQPPETKPVATPDSAAIPRDKILLGFQGSYGFANYQQPQDNTAAGFNQIMRGSTWGFEISGNYAFSRYIGAGALASIKTTSGSANTSDQGPGGGLNYTTTIGNTALLFGGMATVSILGNLGSLRNSHDVRAEIGMGYSLNWATMDLNFGATRPPNFPATGTTQGKVNAPAAQAGFVYAYSISESFRVKIGAYYTRYFYSSIYGSGLDSNPVPPGQFKPDFEKNISQTMQNPNVVSLSLGLEFSF